MKRYIILLVTGIILSGCVADTINSSVINYKSDVQHKIALGDSKSKALSLLLPLHSNLNPGWLKPPEQFIKEGKYVYIHFQRTGLVEDNLVTDDEFTPYIFVDDKLAGIGWSMLGGPKSFGQKSNNDLSTSLMLLSLSQSLSTGTQGTTGSSSSNSGTTYFLNSSYISGLNRICIYKFGGSEKILTMSNRGICPQTTN